MGYDMITEVFRKVDGKYEKMGFYTADGKEMYLFATRDGMLNQALMGYNRHGYDFEEIAYKRGLPEWYSDTAENEHELSLDDMSGTYYDYLELVAWSNVESYKQIDWMATEEAGIGDWSEHPEKAVKRHPLKEFVHTLALMVEGYGIWYPKPGEVMVVLTESY